MQIGRRIPVYPQVMYPSYYVMHAFKFFLTTLMHFVDFNECADITCKNNGTCSDGVGTYSCICKPGFTGIHCETGIKNSILIK